jgi:hypothetical protein
MVLSESPFATVIYWVIASRYMKTALVFLLLLATATAQQSQPPARKGVIYGVVFTQDGEPAKGLRVTERPLDVDVNGGGLRGNKHGGAFQSDSAFNGGGVILHRYYRQHDQRWMLRVVVDGVNRNCPASIVIQSFTRIRVHVEAWEVAA